MNKKEFEIGDVVQITNKNSVYTGTIENIGDFSVTIKDSDNETLYEFGKTVLVNGKTKFLE